MRRPLLLVLLASVAVAAPADNSVLIGNGSTYQPKTFSDCTGAAQAIRYTDSTNALSCGTVSGVAASGLACSDCVELGAETTGGYAASVSEGGPATTATALAADPADCGANQFAQSIAASGALTCSAIGDADVPNTITVDLAATATALAANGANCSAGNAPLGVDTAGAAESCYDVATQAELDTHAALTNPHSATAANTADRIVLRGAAGEFAAGAITASLVGNASTATALAGDPADCGANTFANAIAASGALTCAEIPLGSATSGNYAGSASEGGAATTATALAADPTDCGASAFATAIDASGNLTCAAAGGGLTRFTEAESTSAPNATVYVDSLTAAAASTNADVAFVAKGTGATLAQVPDGTAAGGNKRGIYATDWQKSRPTAAAAAVASGARSTVSGGTDNTGSGGDSTVGGGWWNSATGIQSTIPGGSQNNASGLGSTAGGGGSNQATGQYSTIPGGFQASTLGLYGRFSYASGVFADYNDAQMGLHVTRRATSDATATRLTAKNLGPTTATVNVLPNSHAYMVRAEVVARQNTTGDAKAWLITALVKRGASAATTVLVGAPTVTVIGADAGAAAWTATVVADTTRGAIEIEVVGEAGKTIRWVGTMYTTEVGG